MPDLVIRGMRIPPQCVLYDEHRLIYYKCPFADEGNKWGVLVCTCPNQKRGARIVNDYTETRHPDCPLIPILEGHGRLIDADAFKSMCLSATKEARPDFIRHEDWLKSCAVTMSFCSDIDEQPTIVPAEGGTEDA